MFFEALWAFNCESVSCIHDHEISEMIFSNSFIFVFEEALLSFQAFLFTLKTEWLLIISEVLSSLFKFVVLCKKVVQDFLYLLNKS
jgi:hypothetical protein